MKAETAILRVEQLSVHFGGVRAVESLSFEVPAGQLICIIGPNGAGKTTAMRAVTGVVKPQTGTVSLAGADISRCTVHARVRAGLAFSQQIVRPLRNMTVLQNVMLAAAQSNLAFGMRTFFASNSSVERGEAMRLLRLLAIEDAADKMPSNVPLGYLKRLEMARALALTPKLLLLDEPLAGLSQSEARKLADTIAEINRQGLAIVLIEHNLREVIRIAQRLIVLEQGRILAQGHPTATIALPEVQLAYLGRKKSHASP